MHRRKYLLQDVFTLKLAPGFLNQVTMLNDMLKANTPDEEVSQCLMIIIINPQLTECCSLKSAATRFLDPIESK